MQHQMHLTIAYSKIKKRNLVLINNDTHWRETLTEWPIRIALRRSFFHWATFLCDIWARISLPKFNWLLVYNPALFKGARDLEWGVSTWNN